MDKHSRIFMVGHADVVDLSLVQYSRSRGYTHIFFSALSRVNVLEQSTVRKFPKHNQPEYVFVSSVRSGERAAPVVGQYAIDFSTTNDGFNGEAGPACRAGISSFFTKKIKGNFLANIGIEN